jgi:CheY-like chemotaxis protein
MFSSDQIWRAVDALALERGLSVSRLSILAGLDPTALNKSKRIGTDGTPRWMSTETVAKILTVTGTSLDQFAEMIVGADTGASVQESSQISSCRWLGPKGSVLLVDPDEAFSARAATILGGAGYNLYAMPDFRRALAFVESGLPIDLLMIHLTLPHGVHGSALARIAMVRRPQSKILFLADDAAMPITGEGLGPVLKKPLDDARLVSEATRILQS